MNAPDLREYDLERLELAYVHNPDVLGLIAALREIRERAGYALKAMAALSEAVTGLGAISDAAESVSSAAEQLSAALPEPVTSI